MNIQIIASGSKGNCYRISDGQTALLLDAGIPFRRIQEAIGFTVSELGGVLITHEHQDHARAVQDFLKRGTKVYASKGAASCIHDELNRICTVEPLHKFNIGTFTVLPFDVEHDAAEPLGFYISSTATGERLLYFTDTFYLKYRFEGITHIMGECNYSARIAKARIQSGELPEAQYKRLVKSHMSIETFIEFLRANDTKAVRQIYLLHMSDGNGDETEFKRAVQELTGTEVYVC